MDNLDDLLKSAADDWRERSKKPMRRSALAFIALGGGSVITGGRLPSIIGTAVIGAVAVATWYLWPSASDNGESTAVQPTPVATTIENTPRSEPTLPAPNQQPNIATSPAAPAYSPRGGTQQPVTEAPAAQNLSSPIFPSERPRLSAQDLAEERRLREAFRQAAAMSESDPVAAVSMFVSIAKSYEARKNYNHARYALLQARDLAATGAGDSEQVRAIEEALQRLQK